MKGTMKTRLTKEQSKHLIDLGVPEEMASEVENGGAGNEVDKYIYTFTLTDLLEMLPKEIEHHSCISIDWNFITEKWDVDYDCTQGSWHGSEELIDALYELTVHLLNNNLYENH